MQVAFKEWAVIVDALEQGEQILVLRKGGILEGKAGFQVEHPRFLLFPTLYHQQRESVWPAAQERYDRMAPHLPSPDRLRIGSHAEVVAWHRLENIETVRRLRGQHIWRDEVIEQRHAWGRDQNIFALALRVHLLPAVVELPMLPAYGGCKSWVELDQEIEVSNCRPALDDAAFARKLQAFEEALTAASAPDA